MLDKLSFFFMPFLRNLCLSFAHHLFIGDFVFTERLCEASSRDLVDKITFILKCFFSFCQLFRLKLLLIPLLGFKVEWLGSTYLLDYFPSLHVFGLTILTQLCDQF